MIATEIQAAAKINWSLEIVGQREDGYHLLRSLMQTIDLYDTLTLAPASVDSCLRQGREAPDDLTLRAWQLLKAKQGIEDCLAITIHKRIPVAAGLGGGSADAAALLQAANSGWDLGLDDQALAELGLALGADLPYCLQGGFARVEGIGERVTALPGREYPLLLINPAVPVPTAAVYAGYGQPGVYNGTGVDAFPHIDALQEALCQGRVGEIAELWGNSLEKAAFNLKPQLYFMKELLRQDNIRCLLSGSGGTFFAVMESRAAAEAAAATMGHKYPWLLAASTLV